jgi:hypothetical protein
VCSIAQKKTHPIKPCTARLYGHLGGIGYVSADGERKHLIVRIKLIAVHITSTRLNCTLLRVFVKKVRSVKK